MRRDSKGRARQLALFEMPESDRTAKRRKFEALKAEHHKRCLSPARRTEVVTYKLRSLALRLAHQLWPDQAKCAEHVQELYHPGHRAEL